MNSAVDPFLLVSGIAVVTTVSMLTVGLSLFLKETPDQDKNAVHPVEKPKTIKPAERIYGHQRRLIEAQRAWLAAESVPHQDQDAIADEGFEAWFAEFVDTNQNPSPNSVIPFDAWVLHYSAFCKEKGYPRLSDQQILNSIANMADANRCGLNEQGEILGAQLKL